MSADPTDRTTSGQVAKARIAVVGPHAPYRGGIAHFTNRLCAELESEGQSVVRVSFSRLYPGILFPGKTQFEPGTPDNWRDDTGQSERTVYIDSVNPITWLKAGRKLKATGVKVVVFMVWMPFFAPVYAIIAGILQKAGVRILAIVHNALPHERHIGDKFLTSMFLKRCDSLVALSTAVCEEIKNVVPGADPKHIPHPVYDHFGDLISREEARQNLGWSADAPILLFFGLVRHYKGLHVLLDALPEARKGVPGLQLVVAGEFYESSRQYADHIRRLGIDSMITLFDEYIPSERVPELFGACDVVVQPYISATQSGIVQMAFHFERPVIVTDVGGLSEAVGARGAGLVVPPSDPQALVDAIYHFFEPGVREQLEQSVCSIKATSSWNGYTRFILT